MKTLQFVPILWIGLFSQDAGAQDRIGLIRVNDNRSGGPLFLHDHAADGPPEAFVGTIQTSISRLKKTKGAKPVRYAFPADWNGNGVDELVLVREWRNQSDRRLDLRVDSAPEELFDRLGPKLASSSKRDLGFAVGPERVVALGAADTDGDGRDELVTIRAGLSGTLSLDIRRYPAGRKRSMGAPIASDLDLGIDPVLSLFGVDLVGDAAEELVLLRRDSKGVDRLEILSSPSAPLWDTGPPIASLTNVTAAAPFENLSAARFQPDELGPNRLLLVQRAPGGGERLAVHALPQTVGEALGAALLRDDQPGALTSGTTLFGAFSMGGTPTIRPDLDALNGAWRFGINMNPLTPGGPSVTVVVPAVATVNGLTLTINVLQGPTLVGSIQNVNWPTATIQFPSTPSTFVLPDGSGSAIFSVGTTLLSEWFPGIMRIDTDCGGPTGICGTVVDPSGNWFRDIGLLSFNQF